MKIGTVKWFSPEKAMDLSHRKKETMCLYIFPPFRRKDSRHWKKDSMSVLTLRTDQRENRQKM